MTELSAEEMEFAEKARAHHVRVGEIGITLGPPIGTTNGVSLPSMAAAVCLGDKVYPVVDKKTGAPLTLDDVAQRTAEDALKYGNPIQNPSLG